MFEYLALVLAAIFMGAYFNVRYPQQDEQKRIDVIVVKRSVRKPLYGYIDIQNKKQDEINTIKERNISAKSDLVLEDKTERVRILLLKELYDCPEGEDWKQKSKNEKKNIHDAQYWFENDKKDCITAVSTRKAQSSVLSILEGYIKDVPSPLKSILLLSSSLIVPAIMMIVQDLLHFLKWEDSPQQEMMVYYFREIIKDTLNTLRTLREMKAIMLQSQADLERLLDGLSRQLCLMEEEPPEDREAELKGYFELIDNILKNVDSSTFPTTVPVAANNLKREREIRNKHKKKPWKKHCSKY